MFKIIKIPCESRSGGLYLKLLRKLKRMDCEKGDITLSIKIDCPPVKRKARRK